VRVAALVAAASAMRPAQSAALAALVTAAKAEGSVIVDGPPIDAVRDMIVSGFQRRTGYRFRTSASGTAASGAPRAGGTCAGNICL